MQTKTTDGGFDSLTSRLASKELHYGLVLDLSNLDLLLLLNLLQSFALSFHFLNVLL